MDPLDTDSSSLDAVVDSLAAGEPRWRSLSTRERADLLAQVRLDTWRVAPDWHRASCAQKGIDPDSSAGAEELLAGIVMFARLVEVYEDSLRHPHPDSGEGRVRVLPSTWVERLLFTGVRADVWSDRPATLSQRGGVAVVLGAGNVASLTPRDALHHLVVEGRVVLVKANPVNEYLVEYWERALRALIDVGAVVFVRGGVEVGQHLLAHPSVTAVHVTGAAASAAAIASRVREGVEFTSELGSVTPVIIVPGDWRRREMTYQVDHVATMLVNNAGCNCLTPRVLVTARGWAQRDEFVELLEARLEVLGTRTTFYPRSSERQAEFLATHPRAHVVGSSSSTSLPWALDWGLSPESADSSFREEYFCPALVEVRVEETDPASFLNAAVEFANSELWGTLATTVLIDPRTRRRAGMNEALRRAVADLRYGTVAVNVFHGLGIALGTTTWGAYPSDDPGAGRGVVGNGHFIAGASHSVLEGPFYTPWTPAWFVTRTGATRIGWRLLSWTTRHRPADLAALGALVVRP